MSHKTGVLPWLSMFSVLVLGLPIVQGEVVYHTGFNDGLPKGWSVVDGAKSGRTWMAENPLKRTSPNWTGRFMIVDNDWGGWSEMDEQLVTPAIDCSLYCNVVLRFRHRLYAYREEVVDVDVRVGAGPWQNVFRFQGPEPMKASVELAGLVEIDLAPIVDARPDVQVRWHYVAKYGWFWGIDDVEIRGTYIPDDPNVLAQEPHPPDDAQGVDVESKLTWEPGLGAVTHRVLLSTDFDVANDTDNGVLRGDAQFDPGPLGLGKTYFWRVDESDGSQWRKGGIWSFTAADTIVIDDFESYTNDSPYGLHAIWLDSGSASIAPDSPGLMYGNGTGACAGHDPAAGPIMESAIVRDGRQSIPLYYDNSGSEQRLPYSQIEAILGLCQRPCVSEPLDVPQNWPVHEARFLSLWLHGDVNNAAEQLYLGLEDGGNHFELVKHPGGPDAIRIPQWRQWCIDLEEFTAGGVDLAQVRRIVIGLGDPNQPTPGGKGLLYIDDIQLQACACPPCWSFASLAPAERIEVRYRSHGCFHWHDYRLIFQWREEPTMTAYGTGSAADEIGTVTLSLADLAGLDKLINFYRSGLVGGCTTVDTVSLQIYLGDRLMAEEQFQDDTCDSDFIEDVTTFADLVRRLPKGD